MPFHATGEPVAAFLHPREALIKSFDKHRTNGNTAIKFIVGLSNYERNQFIQGFPSIQSTITELENTWIV
jgi:hypothetical protein